MVRCHCCRFAFAAPSRQETACSRCGLFFSSFLSSHSLFFRPKVLFLSPPHYSDSKGSPRFSFAFPPARPFSRSFARSFEFCSAPLAPPTPAAARVIAHTASAARAQSSHSRCSGRRPRSAPRAHQRKTDERKKGRKKNTVSGCPRHKTETKGRPMESVARCSSQRRRKRRGCGETPTKKKQRRKGQGRMNKGWKRGEGGDSIRGRSDSSQRETWRCRGRRGGRLLSSFL